jgi:hypothetical protein
MNNNTISKGEQESAKQQCCASCGKKKHLGLGWHRESTLSFCRSCWPSLDPAIEWFEERYTLLQNCIGDVLIRKPPLFFLLGESQAYVTISDGEWLTEQVIKHLSLPGGDISFEFVPMKTSVAGTVEPTGGKYLIRMSRDLEDNFRAVSAILIHEMMHIYLSTHGIFYKTTQEYEEATDLACVMMGFGIPLINAKRAWKVDRVAIGRGEQRGTSYHILGYLTEQQIGYAFGTFLAKRNITEKELLNKIDPQCWHIATDGLSLEMAFRKRLAARRKSRSIINQLHEKQSIAEFSCPVCFQKMGVPANTIARIGVLKINCPKCKSEVHFDGIKVIKFIESLK